MLIANCQVLICWGSLTAWRVHLSRAMNEIAEQLKERTMRFALRVMRFCRAKSHRDFVSKIGTVVEESDESVFWLKFVGRSELGQGVEQNDLLTEGRELLAIFIQSSKTASSHNRH